MARRVLAIFFAILLAVVGTVAVLLYVRQADDRALANSSPVNVLIARERVPAGTTGESIRTRDLTERVRMPAGSVPLDEVLNHIPAELDKLVVTSDLQPGQLVLRRMFSASTRTAGGLAIPEGKVAVSFEATMAEQVAGYVRPGSQVAVFATYQMSTDGKNRIVGGSGGQTVKGTAVLLPKVEVIAIGPYGEGSTTTTPLDGKTDQKGNAKPAVLVTVAVTAVEAAKLIQVAQGNALYLALLNDSSQVRPGVGVDSQSLFG
jgi:pilus assembly protein CpaB